MGEFQRFLRDGRSALGLGDLEFVHQGVKAVAVLREIDRLDGGAHDLTVEAATLDLVLEGSAMLTEVWPPNWTITPSASAASATSATSAVMGSKNSPSEVS